MNHTAEFGYLKRPSSPVQSLSVIHSQHLGGTGNVQDIRDRMWKHLQTSDDGGLFRVIVKWEEGDNPSSRQVEAVSQTLLEALGVEDQPAYVVRDDSADTPSIDLTVRVEIPWDEKFLQTKLDMGERITSALQQLDREFGWGEFWEAPRDPDVKQEDVPDWQMDEEAYSLAIAWLEDGAKFGCMHDIPNLLREDAEKYVIKASAPFEKRSDGYSMNIMGELGAFLRGEKMDIDDIYAETGRVLAGMEKSLKEKLPTLKRSLKIIQGRLRDAPDTIPSSSLYLATRLAGRLGEQDERWRVDFER